MSTTPSQLIPDLTQRVHSRIENNVRGQSDVIRLLFGAFLIGGHVLLEGPPGVGKTLIARTFASMLGLSFRRIQFTPDLMPSDITGVSVFDQKNGEFRFVPGPIHADIVLADEINRTPPKTQAALLEAMQERSVTVDGIQHALHPLFFVIATQNPVEHEGTYPLPEAQLDRFLFKLTVGYPSPSDEMAMVQDYSTREREQSSEQSKPIGHVSEFQEAAHAIRQVKLSATLGDYIFRLVQASREHPDILLGASPRAGLHLALASKYQAASNGRDYVVPDDVRSVMLIVLGHRIILKPESFSRIVELREIMEEIAGGVKVPDTVM